MINRQTFTIPFKLPSLNEYVLACRRNKYAGANFKTNIEQDIGLVIRTFRLHPVMNKCIVCMTFVEGNRKRDVDNVESGKKFCLDSLVSCGILQGDSPKWVVAAPSFTVYDKAPRVIVELIDSTDVDALHAIVRAARAAYEGEKE
jgi:hypothetical protein